MTHFEIVKKLIGDVSPKGESHIDSQRLENLKELIKLADEIIGEIHNVARLSSCSEYSIKIAGEKAKLFLEMLKEQL